MKANVEIDITPDMLAKVFVEWGNDEQGKFFNLVGKYFKSSDFDSEMQCSYMADEINKDGKDFIYTVANFLKVRGMIDSPKFGVLVNTYDGDSINGY